LRVLVIAVAVVAAAWVLYRLERLAFLLAVAMFFAYVVAPLVRFAERPVRAAGRPRGLSRGFARVCGFLAVLRIVQDYVVYPRLIRHGIHLHPLAVIVAVLAGVELGGVVGIFLAIPTVAVVSVTYRHWVAWRAADEGLGGLTATDQQGPLWGAPVAYRLAPDRTREASCRRRHTLNTISRDPRPYATW
jgi:predicted PurR-regulated permease PerM